MFQCLPYVTGSLDLKGLLTPSQNVQATGLSPQFWEGEGGGGEQVMEIPFRSLQGTETTLGMSAPWHPKAQTVSK